MKHLYKRIIMIASCVALSFCVMSCDIGLTHETTETTVPPETTETTVPPENNPYLFETVNELIMAIKRNPSFYYNEEVTVNGTILKAKNYYTAICDLSDISNLSSSLEFDFEVYNIYTKWKEANFCIDIEINDELLYAVVVTGDYVKLCGTVKVADGEFYLDVSKCEVLKFASERK